MIEVDLQETARDLGKRVPGVYRGAEVEIPGVRKWVTELVDGADHMGRINTGRSLLITGSVGTGKTHQAYAAVAALALSGRYASWQFVFAPDLYSRMRPSSRENSEEVFRSYAHSPVLILDDLGSDKRTDWTDEVNVRLFNYRSEWMRPTIITTNLPPKNMPEALGSRVASRIAGMLGGHDPVVMNDRDRRVKR